MLRMRNTDNVTPRSFKSRKSLNYTTESSSSLGSDFGDEDEEADLRFNIDTDKFNPQELFITDFVKKKNLIDELIIAMLLCHERNLVSSSNDFLDKEEEGIFDMCSKLGYSLKLEKSQDSRFLRTYEINIEN